MIMAKKSTVKQTAVKKTEPKKTAAKETAAVKKGTSKKPSPKKKETAKKSAAKKAAPAKKTAAKPAPKKTAPKRAAAEPPEKAAPFNLPASAGEVRYSDGELAMLREKQLELAMDGDRQMLIWLGRSVLGQAPAPARAGRADAGETAVIVLTPDEAAALYPGR